MVGISWNLAGGVRGCAVLILTRGLVDPKALNQCIADMIRRNTGKPTSLADFRPPDGHVLVRDIESELPVRHGFFGNTEAFEKKYPNAWGYVRAFRPGFSNDCATALIVFEGGPVAYHGHSWIYLLKWSGRSWRVSYRKLH